MQARDYKFGVVILAAGASRRMGRPKLLLPWGQTSVVGHLVQKWTQLGAAQITTVCAGDALVLGPELDRIHFSPANRIVNLSPEQLESLSLEEIRRLDAEERQREMQRRGEEGGY